MLRPTVKRITGDEKSIGRQQFARELSLILGYPINDCRVIIDAYESLITELIKKDITVNFREFGSFVPRHVEARDYHDVCHQGQYVTKPAHVSIKFKPSEALIQELNDDEQS